MSIMPLLYCGACYYCRRGLNHLCVSMACIGLSYELGRDRRLAVVPATHVTPLPETVSDLQGALVEPTAVAAYGVDVARGPPRRHGAGHRSRADRRLSPRCMPRQLGARVVISEVNPTRADLARSLDVGEVLDPTQVDVAAWLKDRTEGVGADAVIECSGNERALQTAIDAVRSAGRISQTGLHTKAAAIEPMKLSEHDITLTGTWCYPVTDWPRIIDLIARGRLPVEKVVTAQVPMVDVVARGFEVLLSPTGDQVKVLIDAQQGGAR